MKSAGTTLTTTPPSNYPNLRGVMVLSLSFFVMFLAFFSAVSIFSKILKESGFKNLGFYSVATLYLFFSCGCLIAPTLASTERFSHKQHRTLQIAGITVTLWIFTGYLAYLATKDNDNNGETALNDGDNSGMMSVVSVVIILAAALNGFGSSILWTAQGKYLAECLKLCEYRAGMYSSIFWTLTLGS